MAKSSPSKRGPLFHYIYDRENCDKLFKSKLVVLKNLRDARLPEPPGDQTLVTAPRVQESSQRLKKQATCSKQCSYCNIEFDNSEDQRQHYKLDWHRYNIKQSLEGKPSLPETGFNLLVERMERRRELQADSEDSLSISGSDSDDEDKEEDRDLTQNPKFYLLTGDGMCFSIYKSLLVESKSRDVPSDEAISECLAAVGNRLMWAVFMLGGGHFAGAIFNGEKVVVHKTFHCYTVRAKQGGSQGSADNRSGTNHPKSAGASLRRYNEMALVQHVQDITKLWSDELAECQYIFYRAGSNSKNVIFGGKTPALVKGDPRLRTVPFPTKRATFREVKRVHELLSRVEVYESLSELEERMRMPRRDGKSLAKSRIHRSKSRDSPVRQLPEIVLRLAGERSDSGGEDTGGHLVMEKLTLETGHLAEFGASVSKKKKRKKKKNASINSDLQELEILSSGDEVEEEGNSDPAYTSRSRISTELQNMLITSARSGNVKLLSDVVARVSEDQMDSDQSAKQVEHLVNSQFGDSKLTCLHLASQGGHRGVVEGLLELGADPSVRDKTKRVPYTLCKDKETRTVYRKFQGLHPSRYDWKGAQVPPPPSPEEEAERERKAGEKKAAKRQEKREKEKIAKGEERKAKEAQQERERYLAMSDREKRALAAERRILASGGTVSTVLRCFECGIDITTKVPFTYSDNQFCSPSCVKKHRGKNS